MDSDADYLAEPQNWCRQIENSRNGQSLFVHLSVPVVGEASEPRRLQEATSRRRRRSATSKIHHMNPRARFSLGVPMLSRVQEQDFSRPATTTSRHKPSRK